MNDEINGLKKRILEEMTVNYANALERNFELANKFISTTSEGKVDVSVKDKISNKEKIALYLIGKLYAKTAKLSETDAVGNEELMNELSMPDGSVRRTLKELRDEGTIIRTKEGNNVFHSIKLNLIERILKSINEKTSIG